MLNRILARNYPAEQHVKIWIFPERLEITPLGIKILYTKLSDIKSTQAGKRISSSGLFWMADRIVTTLKYTDESDQRSTKDLYGLWRKHQIRTAKNLREYDESEG